MSAIQLHRRELLGASLGLGIGLGTGLSSAESAHAESQDLVWHDLAEGSLEGRAFDERAAPYDRLPARAKDLVRPPVWTLSQCSAGMAARFQAATDALAVRYRVTKEELAMPHMPASGASGIDLYSRAPGGTWSWVQATRPTERDTLVRLAGLAAGKREWLLYLPLYNGVESIALGVPEGVELTRLRPPERAPVVFYGTSIMQGACASRPGMALAAILGRRLDVETINLGFSGQGRMDPELGVLVSELDASIYVIDCLPNMGAEAIAARTVPFVRALRKARPDTPIVVADNRRFANAHHFAGRARRDAEKKAALRAALDELRAEKITGLHHLEDAPFLGTDGEATVDGSHPTDLGMVRYADAYEPLLRRLLAV